MNILKTSTICAAAFMLAGCAYVSAQQSPYTQSQCDPSTLVTSTNASVGVYYATAKMTNSIGGIWITPSNGVTSCTFQDVSGFALPYTWSAIVVRHSDYHSFVTTNSTPLIFTATNTTSYSFTVYVNSPTPPPTNGQMLTLQAQWQ